MASVAALEAAELVGPELEEAGGSNIFSSANLAKFAHEFSGGTGQSPDFYSYQNASNLNNLYNSFLGGGGGGNGQKQQGQQQQKSSKSYFGWVSAPIIIWLVLAFLVIIFAIFSVGCGFSSVCEACGLSSYNLCEGL